MFAWYIQAIATADPKGPRKAGVFLSISDDPKTVRPEAEKFVGEKHRLTTFELTGPVLNKPPRNSG